MTDKAAPAVGEQLSAWLDNELPAVEQELLLARLDRDAGGSESRRHTLVRYALIGDALRGGPVMVPPSLAARVRDAIESTLEPGPTRAAEPGSASAGPAVAPGSPAPAFRAAGTRSRRWLVPAGLAAAALVAGIMLRPDVEPAGQPFQAQTTAPLLAGSTGPAPRPAPPATALSADRFTSYLVYHGEYTGMLSNRVADSHIVAVRPALLAGSDLAAQGDGGR